MSPAVIQAEGLGKRYQINAFQRYDALRDSLAAAISAPARLVSSVVRRTGASDRAPRREPFWALRDVSFDIDQGEIVGLIGRNGAGKSTLLKVLSRITEPTAGTATLHGRVGSLLEVGTGFHAELTGRENIFLNGAILGMRRAEIGRKFDEIVEFAGIGRFLDTPLKRYSSGMEVRLGFSVAAHLETEILLVDEVLAVGDVDFQRKCLGKMRDVTSEGRTVVFVSHNLTAVRGLCPRAILLRGGHLEADGDTDAVIAMYLADTMGGQSAVVEGEELDRQAHTTLSPEHPQPIFQVRRIALLDLQGTPRSTFRSDEAFEIVVAYEVRESASGMGIACQIVNDERDVILQTEATDCAESGLPRRTEPGDYEARCRIPPNLFGEKRLHVTTVIWAGSGNTQETVFESILDFEIAFQGYNDNYDAWSRQGYIRPELVWTVETLDT
jgi:homopolymeric O-antigen transport system ATP-binding protein